MYKVVKFKIKFLWHVLLLKFNQIEKGNNSFFKKVETETVQ